MSLATPEKIRSLQRKLYVKAKSEPKYRFYLLYDKVYRTDMLAHAYQVAKANKGAPGVDGITFEQIEAEGVEGWVQRLQEELRTETYRPEAVRRVYIPKPGGGERPLGIPTVRDRVVQTAAMLVLSPIFEAEFSDEMYGYRPNRSAQQAVAVVHQALKEGYREVVDADLTKYFDTIPHAELLRSVARRVSDGKVLHLLKLWLKTPIEETDERGRKRRSGGRDHARGTPQGGVVSPLLANIYMNRFLRAFRERGMGEALKAKVVSYADDFVILCRKTAAKALEVTRRWMAGMKLAINEEKTALRDTWRECFDFLGYTFGPMVYKPTGTTYTAARPSRKAEARLRVRVREHLNCRNTAPWEEVVKRTNGVLRGWGNYFNYGCVGPAYGRITRFVLMRARRVLVRRHKVPGRGYRRYGYGALFGPGGFVQLRPPRAPRSSHALA